MPDSILSIMSRLNTVIIGAGPIGIETASALQRAGLETCIVEAGPIGATIATQFPPATRFFSSPDRLAIAGMALSTLGQEKPTREEYLAYLRSVVATHELDVRTFHEVQRIKQAGDCLQVETRTRSGQLNTFEATNIVIATGGTGKVRTLDIPASVFWIDRPYQQSYNDCVFDPERYSDPAAMSQTLTDRGFKLVLWHAPYTSEESDAFEQANAEEMFIEGPQVFLNFGRMMDFTNPATVDLWQDLLSRFSSLGVAGYKLDYAEDIQVGLLGARMHFSFFDGSDELTMHHKYS